MRIPSLLRLLTLCWTLLSTMVVIWICLARLIGPHASISQAFLEFQDAYLTGKTELLASVVSPDDLQHFDEIRQLALNASLEKTKSLDFFKRSQVLNLRAQVRNSKLDVGLLSQTNSRLAYVSALPSMPPPKESVARMQLLFVFPISPSKSRAYVTPPDIESFMLTDVVLSVKRGVWLDFERNEGRWLIGSQSLVRHAMAELEPIAKSLEPSGNRFIFRFMLGTTNPKEIDQLWYPLLTNGQG